MRSSILNRTNRLVLGIRRDRIVADVKDGLRAAVRASAFFFRHVRQVLAGYPLTLERQSKPAQAGTARIALAAEPRSPRLGSFGPQRCWHSMCGMRHPSVATG